MKHSLIALALLAAASPALSADPNLARNLAATCANCHGTNGQAVPDGAMARLVGLSKADLLQRLNEYRNGQRPGTIMHQIAKGYTEAQLELIAGYYAAQGK